MNILSELTEHLVMASKNLKIKPKSMPLAVLPSIELSEVKTPQISPPMPSHEAFMPSLLIQKPELKPISLESPPYSVPTIPITQKPSFSLGSIEEFVENNSISMIVCDGPMKPVKIKREGRLEQTTLTLSRSEIDSIINAFSRRSNIPLKPVFRAKVENISILALVSSIESRFMLTLDR